MLRSVRVTVEAKCFLDEDDIQQKMAEENVTEEEAVKILAMAAVDFKGDTKALDIAVHPSPVRHI
jgi:hypothetical protein